MPENTLGVMKVHDLVALAAREETNDSTVAEAIEGYVSKHLGEMTPSLLRQIYLCYEQLYEEHLRRGDREGDWLTYALLQYEGDLKISIHEKLYDQEIIPDLTLASAMCVIESKEIHSYTINNQNDRQSYYEKCVEDFDDALRQSDCPNLTAELLHHRAKALRRCGNHKEALTSFLQLLELKPEWHATHGQIVHLGTIHNVDSDIIKKGEESISYILESVLQDASSVPLRVSLAALARLRSYQNVSKKISAEPDDVKKLADIIAMSALEGLDQFYEAYVSFTSMFGYRYSSCSVALAENLPEMVAIPPSQVERRQWVSACEALANTAKAASYKGKVDIARQLSDASIRFADEISRQRELQPFAARVVAKSYIIGQDAEKALAVINKVNEEKVNHWLLYEKANAHLAAKDYVEALKSSKKCFQMAEKDDKGKERVSIYHDQLSACYKGLGDNTQALAQLKLALKKCKNEKYRNELINKIGSLERL